MSLVKTIIPALEKKIEKFSHDTEKVMRNEVHVKTGALRDSIETKKVSKYEWFVGVNGDKLASDARNVSKQDYAAAYLNGHRAFTIYPKYKKALRWEDENGVHFAKYVKIPATNGDPFIKRTLSNLPKIGG